MSDDRYTVQHSAEESRYILVDRGEDGTQSKEIGQEAYAEVTVDGVASRVMYHTEVSPDYGGQGLASVLVQAAVDHAIGEDFAIAPVCPYVVKWIDKHEQYAEHVVAPTAQHLRAVQEHQR
jgi:predicted GNAT family acetyltransferase